MPYQHPYEENQNDARSRQPSPHPDNAPDWGDTVENFVQAGASFGSSVLGSIADALRAVGDAFAEGNGEALTFDKWRSRLDRRIKNGKQDDSMCAWVLGAAFGGIFGIADLVMLIFTLISPAALGMSSAEHLVFPILFFSFLPLTIGLGWLALAGRKRYKYYKRLRSYLNAARDWVCDLPTLARLTLQDRETVERDLQSAVLDGHFPNTTLSDDGNTIYFDAALYQPQPVHTAQAAVETASALTPEETFKHEGVDFLNYLRSCRGKLGPQADEELAAMQKNCAAILGFANNHPEQLGRLRRFQEYYLPTTRKLLDTAQGLSNDISQNSEQAQTIRRDITGILHTLNAAYVQLYDTLLQDVSLDVSTEIDTLEAMLCQDGLTHGFTADFGTGPRS